MSRIYAVVDLETTGGIPRRDKITEIAIVKYDGQEIIEEYQSLVNPERSIPANITRITGITNDMVSDAPRFFEIAKEVIEFLEGTIFVAHNVRFDYQFLREEFKSLGFTFTKKNLCTVRLSRKAFPGLKSYSLGNLIRHFKIEVVHRHRAYDDAYATTILLSKIFAAQENNADVKTLVDKALKLTRLPDGLDPKVVAALPEACGVYYFMDSNGDVVYVGKSINISARAKQHFSKQTTKADKLFQKVAEISYKITGSELASLLLESKEIKKIQPEINRAQKTRAYNYTIIKELDASGYMTYKVMTRAKAKEPLSYYASRKAALSHIEQISGIYDLCLKVNGIDKSKNSCFQYEIQKCQGACIGEEPPYIYNERFIESELIVNKIFDNNFIVTEEGRAHNEKAVFLVEDGHYKGFGYINIEDAAFGIEEVKECIDYEAISPEADMILRQYIWSNESVEVIHF